jgi:DNA polymerase-3 subunit epsilon
VTRKQMLLRALRGEELQTIVHALGLTTPEATSAEAMRQRLTTSRAATRKRMLACLDAPTARAACARCGWVASGDHAADRMPVAKPTEHASHDEQARESRFVAIDFETSDQGRDSACAVALVRVHGQRIVRTVHRLIRPPRRSFVFTHIHGLTWRDVCDAPRFAQVWTELTPVIDGAHFLVAHNARFDQGVLRACCADAGLAPPALPFKCTVRWSRRTWSLPRHNLPTVCEHLGIELRHHDALSDAEACARIMVAVQQQWIATKGSKPEP